MAFSNGKNLIFKNIPCVRIEISKISVEIRHDQNIYFTIHCISWLLKWSRLANFFALRCYKIDFLSDDKHGRITKKKGKRKSFHCVDNEETLSKKERAWNFSKAKIQFLKVKFSFENSKVKVIQWVFENLLCERRVYSSPITISDDFLK